MGKKAVVLMPQTKRMLETVGEQIKLARLRRDLPIELIAERASVSRATVGQVEKGSPSVSMGIYAAVLHAIDGMDKDLLLLAKEDEIGRMVQDINLKKKRASRW